MNSVLQDDVATFAIELLEEAELGFSVEALGLGFGVWRLGFRAFGGLGFGGLGGLGVRRCGS